MTSSEADGDSLSNYAATYTGENLGSSQGLKPEQTPFGDIQSEARSQYGAKRCTPRESFAPSNKFETAPDDRKFVTEARSFGQAGYQKPRQLMRPEHQTLSGGEFYGTTTAASDFAGKRGPAAQPIRPPVGNVSKGKFEGQSQYSTNFTGTIQTPVRSMKPKAEFIKGGAFESSTTNRSQFQPWNQKPAEIIRPVNGNSLQAENRDFQTENARKFNNKGIAVRQSLKPALPSQEFSAKFEGISTAASHYTGVQAKAPAPFLPDNSGNKVSETRDFITEATKQFSEKDYVLPARSMKPPREEINTGKFQGETTSASSFRPYSGAGPAEPVRYGGSDMSQGNHPFQGQTSYGNQFTGQVQPVVRSMKPSSQPAVTGTFDDATTNRTAFQSWKPNPAEPHRPRQEGHWYLSKEPNNYQTEQGFSYNDKGLVARRSMKPTHCPRQW